MKKPKKKIAVLNMSPEELGKKLAMLGLPSDIKPDTLASSLMGYPRPAPGMVRKMC